MHYTRSEKTDKKYTVGQAVKAAEATLRDKNFKGDVCIDALERRELTDLITMEELNNLSESIVGDSYYHA